jgi:hypothetical protein
MMGKKFSHAVRSPYQHSVLFTSGGSRNEWEAFLALTPVFSGAACSASIYNRLLQVVQRSQAGSITRNCLLLEAGLSFFEESLDVDLALMRMLRDGYLEAVRDRPFTFCVRPIKGKELA